MLFLDVSKGYYRIYGICLHFNCFLLFGEMYQILSWVFRVDVSWNIPLAFLCKSSSINRIITVVD